MDWIEPLEQGMVNTEPQIRQISDRVSQIANEIALGPHFIAVPVEGDFCGPVAKAFVMLAGDDHVPGSSTKAQIGC